MTRTRRGINVAHHLRRGSQRTPGAAKACPGIPFVKQMLSKQERSALRVINTIVAIFLALSVAVFPLSMAHAAALAGHHEATAQADVRIEADHDHFHQAASSCAEDANVTVADDCASHQGASGPRGGASCCNLVCHAFEASAAPAVFTPLRLARAVHLRAEEQVAGGFAGRIDRPPRTV